MDIITIGSLTQFGRKERIASDGKIERRWSRSAIFNQPTFERAEVNGRGGGGAEVWGHSSTLTAYMPSLNNNRR